MGEHVTSVDDVCREVNAWLKENWDPEVTVAGWWCRLAAAGYSAPMLPPEAGGRGWTRDLAIAVNTTLAAAGALGPPLGIGLSLVAPTIAAHGTPAQRARFIPPILDGTANWCQLFSEPGAGSDLAGLQTRAVRDGDEWIISGQKVWTSGAQHADEGMLLARTDVDVPKHQGITWFVLDMHQRGVEVRPLREMTGRAMFNEVFLDEVRAPESNIIGGLNNGWAVANTTLGVERASIGGGIGGVSAAVPGSVAGQLGRPAGEFVNEATATAAASVGASTVRLFAAMARVRGNDSDPRIRQGLAELHTLVELGRMNMLRARSGQGRTGGEGNLAKLLLTHTLRRAREIGNQILGPEATLIGSDSMSGGLIQELTVFSPGPSIYGGTDQIQRNIVGERVLGLAKEPSNDRTVPFRDLPKNA